MPVPSVAEKALSHLKSPLFADGPFQPPPQRRGTVRRIEATVVIDGSARSELLHAAAHPKDGRQEVGIRPLRGGGLGPSLSNFTQQPFSREAHPGLPIHSVEQVNVVRG